MPTISHKNEYDLHKKEPASNTQLLRSIIAKLVFKRGQKAIQQWLTQVNATSKKTGV